MATRIALAIGLALSAGAGAQHASAEPGAPACIYRSQTYSEGAAVCVQKGMLLTCAASGERLVWKLAREAELSDLCRAEPVPAHRASISHRARRTPMAARMPASSARCFFFSGKTYCE